MMESILNLEEILPIALTKCAYRTPDGDLAWARDDAVEVCTVLKRMGYSIGGVDTWLPGINGPIVLSLDWESGERPIKGKYYRTAIEFITEFENDEILMAGIPSPPYFNILAAGDG